MDKKVLITEPTPFIEEEWKILEKHANVRLAKGTAEDDLLAEVKDVDVMLVVYAKITKRIIESAPRLKGIVRYGIGVDNVDIRAATEMGVYVANVPDYCIGTVAEHTFALLLALTRKIILADRIVRSAGWKIWTQQPTELMGNDLEGKVLGLIGMGNIGSAVAIRAKAFGMKVIAYDPYLEKDKARSLDAELVDLDTLLKNSDFVSIHVPLTPETRGMIGEQELRKMKRTAYLINTSRGPIVRESALYKALKDGWIAGAALDVYEKEPPDRDNPLFRLDNVVLTPHIAWYTEEALKRLKRSVAEEAIRILNGMPPKSLVNKDVLLGRKTT
ncbi:MAG: C-terminal binding protein [Nitrososphaerota archaeon]|nr:C-terminal binding protein [Aigarchaeota archaeon]MDW8076112.1 C-terminal binding protein [Nitrososphaerota archaeon]